MNRERRNCIRLLGGMGVASLFPSGANGAPVAGAPLSIGLTALMLDDHLGVLTAWRDYIERKMQRPVRFLQRDSYREVGDLLLNEAEFAWVGAVPYLRMQRQIRLAAVPLYQGKPSHCGYLIVPDSDSRTQGLLDLRGKIFAYADQDSIAGHLYVKHELRQLKQRPADFFARVFFTGAQRKVVEAVAAGLAGGGAVDGYLWETLQREHPEVTSRTRVVARSPEFAFPPFVARADVPLREVEALRQALQSMPDDPVGKAVLGRLNLDGFVAGEPAWFDGTAEILRSADGA